MYIFGKYTAHIKTGITLFMLFRSYVFSLSPRGPILLLKRECLSFQKPEAVKIPNHETLKYQNSSVLQIKRFIP